MCAARIRAQEGGGRCTCRAVRNRLCNAVNALLGIAAVDVRVMIRSFVLVVAFMHRPVPRQCGRAVARGRAMKSAVV